MHLAFSFVRDKYPIYETINDGFIDFKHVIKDFNKVAIKVKDECEKTTLHFIAKFEWHFQNMKLWQPLTWFIHNFGLWIHIAKG